MIRSVFFTLWLALAAAVPARAAAPVTIVIHGGAGALEKGRYSEAEEAAYKKTLNEALDAGYGVLARGGAALDAVEAAIVLLEDSPLFNAGRGAVFTYDGKNELDASIMDGATGKAGAAAGLMHVRNPIRLARAIMENSPHVMMIGAGAEEFAETQKLVMVRRSYFRTEARWRAYKEALEQEKAKKGAQSPKDFKYGTVGVVALDARGNLAAGTSTGGMTLKRWGRVGDAPIIGAGTFADNRSCAVSATGWGEYFVRLTIARDICAQVEYGGRSIAEATADVIHNRLQQSGGDGGVIVLAPNGDYVMDFNSAGMFRAARQGDRREVAIYRE